MTGTKKRHSAAFKARVALEAAEQTRTLAELSGLFQDHSVQPNSTVSGFLKRPNGFCTIPLRDGVVRKGVGYGSALRDSPGTDVGPSRGLS